MNNNSISCRDEINQMLKNMWDNRDMKVPHFTKEEIALLPNIFQLIDWINNSEQHLLATQHGWRDFTLIDGEMKLYSQPHLLNKDRVYVNDEDPDKFIVNRLSSGRFSLKPNLRTHRFLFRGQKEHFSKIRSSFDRHGYNRHVLDNIRVEEFVSMLRSHPLFMLFERGIHIDPVKKPFFFEMNYYGLAQHYNFNTGLVDFTSNLHAAAFFATTKNLGDDKYEPYSGSENNQYGVIYIYELNPFWSFRDGMKTIGLQVYPRTGAQKGFAFQEGCVKIPLEKIVTPLFFRHDPQCAEMIFNMMDKGRRLFPEDDLSAIAQSILHERTVSGKAFAHNLYCNQNDYKTNLNILKQQNIKVDWHREIFFTPDDLKQYYENIRNGWWEEFCNQISFLDSNEEKQKDALLNLPRNPHYIQFFDPNLLDLLQYFRIEEYNRVMKKVKH